MGWVLVLAAAGIAGGCAHRIPLEAKQGSHGSDGRVKLVEREFGNRVVDIQIDDLVDPRDVVPTARSYVVWARKAGGLVENVGAMRMHDDRGVLEAVAPTGQFQLFVTVEASEDARAPSNQPIFFADVAK